MASLAGKIAVITGGATGIGFAAGTLFAQEGAQVILVSRNEPALQQAVASIGHSTVSYVVADVTQPDQVQSYVQTVVEQYSGIDILINNAGIEGDVKPIPEYELETFDQVLAVNVRGVWLGLKFVIPELQKRGGGSIVITSSVAGHKGYPGLSAYVASRHAVLGLMRTAALECAPLGIRVNSVSPGPIETDMMRRLEREVMPSDVEQAKEKFMQGLPLQRYGTPAEVAQIMLFLVSDDSTYCTGADYPVDGGISAVPGNVK